MQFEVGRLASGPSWPQRITRLVMKQGLSLEIRNELDELTRLAEWVHAAAGRMQLPYDVLSDVDHCAAEAVHNIIAYAYTDAAVHLIRVTLVRELDRVSLEIEDDGVPFNPLEYPQPR